MNVVSVSRLERRFGYTRVIDALDLDVAQGERVTITGPNGSGKTTLLRMTLGLLRPTTGAVTVFGTSPRDPRVRRRIGVIGHMPPLYPRMTARENLRFWARMYDDADATERGSVVLQQLGLDPADRRAVGTYSQGMRQRVSIARALSTAPELVVADEPLAALDAEGAQAVAALLGEGRTLIAATHDAEPFVGSRRLTLRDGRLQ